MRRAGPEKLRLDSSGVPEMLSKSTITARPGWSALNFDHLLGEPDHTTRVGHVIVKLYTEDRVRQAEASELFQQIKQKYDVRKFSARKSFVLANNEFAKTLDDVIEVAEVLPYRLTEGAIGHYNARRSDKFATRRDDKQFLNEIMAKYAFEVLVRYDREFEARAIAAGHVVLARALRSIILSAVATTYPALANDCVRLADRPI
jgi:hypothetical protein